MKFDKSKIYTAVNADEVKIGSKGYFADTMAGLEQAVTNEDAGRLSEVLYINSDENVCCFSSGNLKGDFALFYLVDEPEGKKFRPYKDTDEMIEDFKRRCGPYGGWGGKYNPMYCPLIWIKNIDNGNVHFVTGFAGKQVYAARIGHTLEELSKLYTYLDGSPVGAEI